jgi:hypothetical protein
VRVEFIERGVEAIERSLLDGGASDANGPAAAALAGSLFRFLVATAAAQADGCNEHAHGQNACCVLHGSILVRASACVSAHFFFFPAAGFLPVSPPPSDASTSTFSVAGPDSTTSPKSRRARLS